MKQKLALCCALVHRPEILFLDEPTTGVDAVSRREFWDLLGRLKAGGPDDRRVDAVHGRSRSLRSRRADSARPAARRRHARRGRARRSIVRSSPSVPSDRYDSLRALREYPQTHTVYPFGESLHYTDERTDAPEPIAAERAARRSSTARGFADVARRRRPRRPSKTRSWRAWARRSEDGGVRPASWRSIAQDLTRNFGDFVAVDRITFDVRAGEVFGFLGANGAGKTTAIRMLTGLLAPSGGRRPSPATTSTRRAKRSSAHIGYMSQRFSLYEDLTVAREHPAVRRHLRSDRREIRERTDAMLSRLGFRARRRTLVRALPLGWRQKLAFSVALLHEPRIVFLDEPTSGVDPITRRQFWELIYEAAAAGTTVLVTTHYMDEAEYCDRISIMVAGGSARWARRRS